LECDDHESRVGLSPVSFRLRLREEGNFGQLRYYPSSIFREKMKMTNRMNPRLAACALLALLAGGCASEKAVVYTAPSEVETVVASSPKPVLMMYFKGGCASCAALEPTFDQLAAEYKDRAVIAKFMILTLVFEVTSPELKDRYGVVFVPHVVLTVNGQEKQHWVMDYNIDDYRKALNEALGKTPPAK
jgi:thiol-disulfide isomerase/thioredoxin